jgi:hypothetical protein
MPKIIEVEIEVGSKQALDSVNDLKTAAIQLEEQLSGTRFGTEEFNRLSQQLKSVRNELKDVDASLEGLDKEQRAAALVDTFNGLTGAVGAVSSAFIAFGAESAAIEDAEKKLLGVIGVVSGLRDVSNGVVAAGKLFGPTFVDAGNAIKAGFTAGATGAQTFRAALISTGIGAFIVAVGFLVDYLIDVGDKGKAAAESLAEIAKQQKKINSEIQALSETGKETAIRSIEEVTEARKKNNEENIRLNEQFFRETNEKEKQALQIKINENVLAGSELEKQEKSFRKTLADLDKKEKEDEVKRTEEQNKKILELKKDRLEKEKTAISEYNQAVRDLGEAQAADEDERITIQFENRITALREAEAKELTQTNLSEAAKKAIRDKYIVLQNLADVEATKSREVLQKAALDKEVAQTEEAFQKISAASQLRISELNVFYDNVLSQFQNLDLDFLRRIFETSDPRKFFGETIDELKKKYQELADKENELAINTETNIKESERRKSEAIRKTALDQIALIEDAQKQQIAAFDEQLKNDQLTIDQREALEKKLNDIVQAGQVRKKQISEKAAQDEVELTNRTAEQIEQRRLSLNNFVTTSVSSLFTTLRSLNQAADSADEADKKAAFERDKTYATAEAIISGILAVQRVFSNAAANPKSILFPAQPYIEAALAGVATVARVKQIQQTTFSSTTGAATGGSSGTGTVGSNVLGGGGSGTVLPQRVLPPTTQGTGENFQDTATGGFGGGSEFVVKTYVLTGDITEAQTINKKLQEKREL